MILELILIKEKKKVTGFDVIEMIIDQRKEKTGEFDIN